jgi:hypothetical protein
MATVLDKLLEDRRIVERGESEAQVELDGRRRTIPVLIGPDQEEPLLGSPPSKS